MAKKQKNIAIYHNLQKKADLLPGTSSNFFSPDFDFMPENILVWKSHRTLRVTASSIHQRMILKLVLSGKCSMLVDGVRIPLKGGDMLCLFPYQFHTTILECPREEYSFLAVTFTEKNKNYNSFSSLKYHVLTPDEKDLGRLEQILDCRLDSEGACMEEAVLALLGILYNQRRKTAGNFSCSSGTKEDFFDRVCVYIRNHFQDPSLNLKTLSDHFGVSSESIRRAFQRAEAAMTAGKLLEQLRMQLALELLEHSSTSVEEIASRCGYSDPFTFSRAFKRVMNCSPAQFRKARKLLRMES